MISDKADLSKGKRKLSGCLDLGSSYFRMLLARRTEAAAGPRLLPPIYESRNYVGWGNEVAGKGHVSEESLERAAGLLSRMIDDSARLGCPDPVIAGTGTFRRAANRRRIISFLRERVNLPIEVLSHRGEAAYSFLGAVSSLSGKADLILIDLGGTTTEIAMGSCGSFENYLEVPFGTHTLVRSGRRPSGRCLLRAIRNGFIRETGGCGVFRNGHIPDPAAGCSDAERVVLLTGGTAVTLGMIDSFMKGYEPDPSRDCEMSMDELQLLIRRLKSLPRERWARVLPVTPRRAELLPAGIVLLNLIIKSLNINMFRVTARDLRWGIILSGDGIAGRYIFNEQESSDSR